MKTFAFRFFVAVLTFIIGTAISSLWPPHLHQIPDESRNQCPTSIVRISPPTVFIPPPTVFIPPHIPGGWHKVEAEGLFAFHLPKSMKLTSTEMVLEARWGSGFSDSRISLYAEYSSWPEGWAPEYLAKQLEYEREAIEISGRRAIVRSWRWVEPSSKYKYEAEVRIYDAQGEKLVEMDAGCKDRQDVETAKQIFKTVEFLQVDRPSKY